MVKSNRPLPALVCKWRHGVFYRSTHCSRSFGYRHVTDQHLLHSTDSFASINGIFLWALFVVMRFRNWICLIFQKYNVFKNYKLPFSYSFKDNFSYWSGIELGRRFIFLLALVPFPRNTVSWFCRWCKTKSKGTLHAECLHYTTSNDIFFLSGLCCLRVGCQHLPLCIQHALQVQSCQHSGIGHTSELPDSVAARAHSIHKRRSLCFQWGYK